MTERSNQQEEQMATADILKALSHKDFLNFGMHDVAYIRPVEVDGRTAYSIHAADGTSLSVLDTKYSALETIRHNDLEAVHTH